MRESMEKTASVSSYVASAGAVFFSLSAVDLAAYIGATVAVLTFFMNWYYKREHIKLERELRYVAPE